MSWSSVPTDSLYKFVAIVGVIMSCFAVFFGFSTIRSGLRESAEIREELLVLQNEVKFVENDIGELKELLAAAKGDSASAEGRAGLGRDNSEIGMSHEEF